jgi:hypothetical protein
MLGICGGISVAAQQEGALALSPKAKGKTPLIRQFLCFERHGTVYGFLTDMFSCLRCRYHAAQSPALFRRLHQEEESKGCRHYYSDDVRMQASINI